MADIRPVTDAFAVAPQLSPEDMALAAALGYRLIINNRPDGEAPGQPTAAEMAAAAGEAGLAYLHLPVVGAATADQVAAMAGAIDGATGPVLAFCRSGTRSITTWIRGRAAAGDDRHALVEAGLQAGYDLSGVI